MNYRIICCLIGWLVISIASSRAQDRCGTNSLIDLYEQQSPGFKERIHEADEEAQQWLKDHPGGTRSVITIPVVVHIVYHTTAQNISDEQIQSQIDVLNEDYRMRNEDTSETPEIYKPLAADCMIEFCLAAYDPNGDTTSGITRTETDIESFDLSDDVKSTAAGGEDGWPASDYLNIWVCNLGNNVLGYATLPTSEPADNDGVVIYYKAFGRNATNLHPKYNLGRTCTHEVGHWLGLVHIWGDDGEDSTDCNGSDNIADTPNQGGPNFHCPTFPHITCGNQGDMSMNYMDYTDDACMNLFTHGQSDKMNSVLQSVRKSIQTSPAGCQGIYFNNDASVSKIIFPEDTIETLSFQPQVQITNRGLNTINSLRIEYRADGQEPGVFDYSGNLVSEASEVITLPLYFTGEGDHIFTAWCSLPNNTTDEYPYNDTTSKEFTVVSSIPKNSMVVMAVNELSPTDGLFRINIQNPSAGDLDLRISNTLGQVMERHFISLATESSFDLDLSHLSNGIYFLYSKIGFDYLAQKVMVCR